MHAFTSPSRTSCGNLTPWRRTVFFMLRTVTFAAIVLSPALGLAQATGTASAEADILFDQGRQLMAAAKIAEGCAAFDASEKLSHSISTLFNLAHCREQNNQLATAYGLFREAERQTRVPLDDKTQQLNKVALDRVKGLEARLSKLTITVAANRRIDGLQIRRGNDVVEPGAWNRALPIDGGSYTIVASAPGFADAKLTITVEATKDAKTVDIPALVPAPVKSELTTARKKPVPLLFASGAVLLLGGALVTDLSARSDYDKALREPDDARQKSHFESAKTKRFVAQGLAVVGVGSAGVALWLYLRSGGQESSPRPLARIGAFSFDPVVTATATGFQLTRQY